MVRDYLNFLKFYFFNFFFVDSGYTPSNHEMFEYDTDNSFSIPNNSVNRLSVKTELDIVKSDKENSISQYVGCSNKKQSFASLEWITLPPL